MYKQISPFQHAFALFAWLFVCLSAANAIANEMAAPPVLKVGDTWTYEHHNRGDKKPPYMYTNTVASLTTDSAWVTGESQEVGGQYPKYVWRYDLKRAFYAERFALDTAAPNQAGALNRSDLKNDDLIRWPLKVGDKFKARTFFTSGNGYVDWNITVEAFEKIDLPGGSFDVYRMKRAGFWTHTPSRSSGRAEVIVWYSPETKSYAKTIMKDWSSTNLLQNDQEWTLHKWVPSSN